MEFIRFAARDHLKFDQLSILPSMSSAGGSWLADDCSSPQASCLPGSSSSGGSLLPSGGSGGGGDGLRTSRALGLFERQLRSPGWSQCGIALAASAAAGGGDCGGGGGDDGSGFRFAHLVRVPGWSQCGIALAVSAAG